MGAVTSCLQGVNGEDIKANRCSDAYANVQRRARHDNTSFTRNERVQQKALQSSRQNSVLGGGEGLSQTLPRKLSITHKATGRASAPNQAPADDPIERICKETTGGLAVLDRATLEAELRALAQPVAVLHVPFVTPAPCADASEHNSAYDTLEGPAAEACVLALEAVPGGGMRLLISTDEGSTAVGCVLANAAAVTALQLSDEQDVLRFLARSFARDSCMRVLFQDIIKRLLQGNLHRVHHFVPGDFGRDRYFLSMRVSPFAYQTNAPLPPSPPASSTLPPQHQHGGGGGGGLAPAMILELDVPYEGKELAARLQRDYMIISNIPSIVTMFDAAGRVVHQNRASIAYMGHMVGAAAAEEERREREREREGKGEGEGKQQLGASGRGAAAHGPLSPPPPAERRAARDGAAQLVAPAGPPNRLQQLFALDPARLQDVAEALSHAPEWRGLVRMPGRLCYEVPSGDDASLYDNDGAGADSGAGAAYTSAIAAGVKPSSAPAGVAIAAAAAAAATQDAGMTAARAGSALTYPLPGSPLGPAALVIQEMQSSVRAWKRVGSGGGGGRCGEGGRPDAPPSPRGGCEADREPRGGREAEAAGRRTEAAALPLPPHPQQQQQQQQRQDQPPQQQRKEAEDGEQEESKGVEAAEEEGGARRGVPRVALRVPEPDAATVRQTSSSERSPSAGRGRGGQPASGDSPCGPEGAAKRECGAPKDPWVGPASEGGVAAGAGAAAAAAAVPVAAALADLSSVRALSDEGGAVGALECDGNGGGGGSGGGGARNGHAVESKQVVGEPPSPPPPASLLHPSVSAAVLATITEMTGSEQLAAAVAAAAGVGFGAGVFRRASAGAVGLSRQRLRAGASAALAGSLPASGSASTVAAAALASGSASATVAAAAAALATATSVGTSGGFGSGPAEYRGSHRVTELQLLLAGDSQNSTQDDGPSLTTTDNNFSIEFVSQLSRLGSVLHTGGRSTAGGGGGSRRNASSLSASPLPPPEGEPSPDVGATGGGVPEQQQQQQGQSFEELSFFLPKMTSYKSPRLAAPATAGARAAAAAAAAGLPPPRALAAGPDSSKPWLSAIEPPVFAADGTSRFRGGGRSTAAAAAAAAGAGHADTAAAPPAGAGADDGAGSAAYELPPPDGPSLTAAAAASDGAPVLPPPHRTPALPTHEAQPIPSCTHHHYDHHYHSHQLPSAACAEVAGAAAAPPPLPRAVSAPGRTADVAAAAAASAVAAAAAGITPGIAVSDEFAAAVSVAANAAAVASSDGHRRGVAAAGLLPAVFRRATADSAGAPRAVRRAGDPPSPLSIFTAGQRSLRGSGSSNSTAATVASGPGVSATAAAASATTYLQHTGAENDRWFRTVRRALESTMSVGANSSGSVIGSALSLQQQPPPPPAAAAAAVAGPSSGVVSRLGPTAAAAAPVMVPAAAAAASQVSAGGRPRSGTKSGMGRAHSPVGLGVYGTASLDVRAVAAAAADATGGGGSIATAGAATVAAEAAVSVAASGAASYSRTDTGGSRLVTLRTAATAAVEGGGSGGGGGSCGWWHEVHVRRCFDPISSEPLTMVIQTDVTSRVRAEELLARVLAAEHRLLADIFPSHVVQYMTQRRKDEAELERQGLTLLRHIQDPAAVATQHDNVTVLFADIKGFTEMSKQVPPVTVMTLLNDLYTRFDSLTDVYGVYKVETIGDCYMVAGGLVARDGDGYGRTVRSKGDTDPLHAMRVVAFARAMLEEAAKVALPNTGEPVQMRVGIHSGPATSGVVGQKMPRFCLFGDTVNTASRMESTGRPGAIHASVSTRVLLPPEEDEELWAPTGGVEVKGKGRMDTYMWCPASPAAGRQRRSREQRAMVLATLSSLYPPSAALQAPAASPPSSRRRGGGGGGGGGGAGGAEISCEQQQQLLPQPATAAARPSARRQPSRAAGQLLGVAAPSAFDPTRTVC